MTNQRPKLSILILTWNGAQVIKKNLDSIFKHWPKDNSWELIVVDNDSKDETKEIVKKYKRIKLIENRKNHGFAKGNNIGIPKAIGKYVLFLNQDIEQKGKAIQKMIDFLDENEKYGLVAPQLLYPNGNIQLSCRPFYNWKNIFIDYLTLGWYRKSCYDHFKSQTVDQPMASVLMIRKKILDKVKGFDAQRDFWIYFNDMDLSYRIHKEGYSHYLLTEAKFFHHHGESTRKLFEGKRLWEYHRGLKRYFLKHHIKGRFSLSWWVLCFLVLPLSFLMMLVKSFLLAILQRIRK
ncbi:MAG: glycosyltransferase family 2 protein [Candidatus Moranbacteria bacterium]|nr:glycosyltransferase family 2 protein [Candidatus Moranbacteria bacterium]